MHIEVCIHVFLRKYICKKLRIVGLAESSLISRNILGREKFAGKCPATRSRGGCRTFWQAAGNVGTEITEDSASVRTRLEVAVNGPFSPDIQLILTKRNKKRSKVEFVCPVCSTGSEICKFKLAQLNRGPPRDFQKNALIRDTSQWGVIFFYNILVFWMIHSISPPDFPPRKTVWKTLQNRWAIQQCCT